MMFMRQPDFISFKTIANYECNTDQISVEIQKSFEVFSGPLAIVYQNTGCAVQKCMQEEKLQLIYVFIT